MNLKNGLTKSMAEVGESSEEQPKDFRINTATLRKWC